MTFKIKGPSFIAIQVKDLDISKKFYTEVLELEVDPAGPPHAVVFKTSPIAFAIREPNINLNESTKLGWGSVTWFQVENIRELHLKLSGLAIENLTEAQPGPFGLFFSFIDPDGYMITVHEPGSN